MKDIFIIILLGLFFSGCTQEHLIFIKNIDHVKLITIDQIMKESGLKPRKLNIETNLKSTNIIKTPQDIQIKKIIPEINKIISVPKNEEFSLNMSYGNNLLVLKSIQGDVKYLKDRSNLESGFYLFGSGLIDSKIIFQLYSIDGGILTNFCYYITIKYEQKNLVRNTNAPITNNIYTEKVQNKVTNNQISGMINSTNSSTPVFGESIAKIIVASIQGMSPIESINELKKMLVQDDFSIDDKKIIQYKLIDFLLSEKMLNESEKNINEILDIPVKQLYQGRLHLAKKKDREALRYYLLALSGQEEVRKNALLEMEMLALKLGTIDQDLISRLESETDKIKGDKEFYGNSLINIAKIYQYLPNIYKAEELLKTVINGDYPMPVLKKAKKTYDDLKRDFLEYR